jgi:hypothetical protein
LTLFFTMTSMLDTSVDVKQPFHPRCRDGNPWRPSQVAPGSPHGESDGAGSHGRWSEGPDCIPESRSPGDRPVSKSLSVSLSPRSRSVRSLLAGLRALDRRIAPAGRRHRGAYRSRVARSGRCNQLAVGGRDGQARVCRHQGGAQVVGELRVQRVDQPQVVPAAPGTPEQWREQPITTCAPLAASPAERARPSPWVTPVTATTGGS